MPPEAEAEAPAAPAPEAPASPPAAPTPAPAPAAAPDADERVNAWISPAAAADRRPAAAEPSAPTPPAAERPAPEEQERRAVPPREAKAGPAPPPAADAAPVADPAAPAGKDEAGAGLPDWRALLDQVDAKELRSHPKVAGVLGSQLERERERLRAELAAEQAAQREKELAAQEDLVGLGELRLQQLRQQAEAEGRQQATQEQQAAQERVFMERVAAFQATLPPPVQQQLAGKEYADFRAYLTAAADAAAAHKAAAELETRLAAEREKWEREALPALEARALAKVRGGEPSPDTQQGGTRPAAREITDEMIAAMDLSEFNAITDGKGRFREGYVYRPTRAVDPRRLLAPASSR